MRRQPGGIALFGGEDCVHEFFARALGARLAPAVRGEEQAVFALDQDLVKVQEVDGFTTMAERIRRDGRTNREHQPATSRAERRRFGARRRERLRISS